MKKYRIIKINFIDGEERYAIEKRFLGFLWREKLEKCTNGGCIVYGSKEKAESTLKYHMYKSKEEVVGEY